MSLKTFRDEGSSPGITLAVPMTDPTPSAPSPTELGEEGKAHTTRWASLDLLKNAADDAMWMEDHAIAAILQNQERDFPQLVQVNTYFHQNTGMPYLVIKDVWPAIMNQNRARIRKLILYQVKVMIDKTHRALLWPNRWWVKMANMHTACSIRRHERMHFLWTVCVQFHSISSLTTFATIASMQEGGARCMGLSPYFSWRWPPFPHTYIYICTHTHTYIHTYIHTHTHTYIHTYYQIKLSVIG
jgi:hypothetical protein